MAPAVAAAAPPPPPPADQNIEPPPTTWTASEIRDAHWPTAGGEPWWRAAPVAEDGAYGWPPAMAASALAAAAGGGPGAAAAPPLFHGFPHYAPEDRYVPRVQADGGVLSGADYRSFVCGLFCSLAAAPRPPPSPLPPF
jgi:hypothetical protein